MKRKQFRNFVGIAFICSHFGLFLALLILTFQDRFTPPQLFTTAGLILPLFAAYTSLILKAFTQGNSGVSALKEVETAQAVISILIPALFCLYLFGVILWKAFWNLDFDNFVKFIGLAEVVFGVYLGTVLKSLFK